MAPRDEDTDSLISSGSDSVSGENPRVEQSQQNGVRFWFCHPTGFGHRVIALTLMCLLGFGSYFCFDNPGALQVELKISLVAENKRTFLIGQNFAGRDPERFARQHLPVCQLVRMVLLAQRGAARARGIPD